MTLNSELDRVNIQDTSALLLISLCWKSNLESWRGFSGVHEEGSEEIHGEEDETDEDSDNPSHGGMQTPTKKVCLGNMNVD